MVPFWAKILSKYAHPGVKLLKIRACVPLTRGQFYPKSCVQGPTPHMWVVTLRARPDDSGPPKGAPHYYAGLQGPLGIAGLEARHLDRTLLEKGPVIGPSGALRVAASAIMGLQGPIIAVLSAV